MVNFTLDAMVSSMPVIRPLWMLDPDDHANLVIDDEFLIGNKVIFHLYILFLVFLEKNLEFKKISLDSCCSNIEAWSN